VAEFSNVTTSGGVSGTWQVKAIAGEHPSNDRADVYVTVEDSAGHSGTFSYPDGSNLYNWTAWKIPLTDLADAGVNMAAVTKMAVGSRPGWNRYDPGR
jgi:hypothetical protein